MKEALLKKLMIRSFNLQEGVFMVFKSWFWTATLFSERVKILRIYQNILGGHLKVKRETNQVKCLLPVYRIDSVFFSLTVMAIKVLY